MNRTVTAGQKQPPLLWAIAGESERRMLAEFFAAAIARGSKRVWCEFRDGQRRHFARYNARGHYWGVVHEHRGDAFSQAGANDAQTWSPFGLGKPRPEADEVVQINFLHSGPFKRTVDAFFGLDDRGRVWACHQLPERWMLDQWGLHTGCEFVVKEKAYPAVKVAQMGSDRFHLQVGRFVREVARLKALATRNRG